VTIFARIVFGLCAVSLLLLLVTGSECKECGAKRDTGASIVEAVITMILAGRVGGWW
jgi:hypothetical protein